MPRFQGDIAGGGYFEELMRRGGERVGEIQRHLSPEAEGSVPKNVGLAALNALGLIDVPLEAALKTSGIGRGGMTVTAGGAELGVDPQEISEEAWVQGSAALGGMAAAPGVSKAYRLMKAGKAPIPGGMTARFIEEAPSGATRAGWHGIPKELRREMQQDPTKFYGIVGSDPKYRGSYGVATPEEVAEWTKRFPELSKYAPEDIRAIRTRETPTRAGARPFEEGMPEVEAEALERFMTAFHEPGHAATLLAGGQMPLKIRSLIDDVFKAHPRWKGEMINRLREAPPNTFRDLTEALYREAAATLQGEQGIKAFKSMTGRKNIPARMSYQKTGLYPQPPDAAVGQWGKGFRNWAKKDFQPQAARHKAIGREMGLEPTPGGPVKKTTMSEADKAKLIERVELEKASRGPRHVARDEATEWLRKHPDATDIEKKKYLDRKGVTRREPYKGKRRPTSEERGTTALDEILKKEGYQTPGPPDEIDEALRADYPELFEEVTPKGVKKPLPAKEEAPITPVRREDIWSSKREPFEPVPTRKNVPPAVKVRLPKGGQPVKGKAPLRKKYTKAPRTVSPEAIRGYRMRGKRMAEKMNKDPKAVITTLVRERLKAQFTPEEIEVFVQKALKGI